VVVRQGGWAVLRPGSPHRPAAGRAGAVAALAPPFRVRWWWPRPHAGGGEGHRVVGGRKLLPQCVLSPYGRWSDAGPSHPCRGRAAARGSLPFRNQHNCARFLLLTETPLSLVAPHPQNLTIAPVPRPAEFPNSCPQEFADLAALCWHPVPDQRYAAAPLPPPLAAALPTINFEGG
jgi:hypothetical protein